MTNKISLTASMRTNLLSLQNISKQVDRTQQRLSTGNKVNSAIDNPSSYYTARSLTNRAGDLDALLDSMGQAVQTIKAATEGIESASNVLEQMRAVTEQTLTEAQLIARQVEIEYDTDVAALEAQGYTVIDSSIMTAELKAILDVDNAKVVLAEDITLTGNLDIKGKNIVVNGGGHKLTMQSGYILNRGTDAVYENMQLEVNYGSSGWYTRGIYSDAANTTVRNVEITLNGVRSAGHGLELHNGGTVENLNIRLNGNAEQLIGVYVWGSSDISNVNVALSGGENTLMAAIGSQSNKVTVDKIGMSAEGGRAYGVLGTVKGLESHAVGGKIDKSSSLFTGEANTDAILADIGAEGLAATAASQFYVGDKDGEFGQGNWYLPSIAELLNVYGYNSYGITGGMWSTSGATGTNKAIINNTLSTLANNGAEAATLTNGYYWSSSECSPSSSWILSMNRGYRDDYSKGTSLTTFEFFSL